jgi:hypothetical protein
VVDRVDHAGDHIAVLTDAVRTKDRHGHDPYSNVADPGDSRCVVGAGRHDPRHPRAVTIGIVRARRTVEDRDACHEIRRQIGMAGVDARVEDGHGCTPGRADGVVGLTPTDLCQRPLKIDLRVIRLRLDGADLIGLHTHHA